MKKKYFDSVKDIIESYSNGMINPLTECKETIKEYNNEIDKNNPYRDLARKFKDWETGSSNSLSNCDYKCADRIFYEFLKEKVKDNRYEFPLTNGETVIAKVDFFNPFTIIKEGSKEYEIVNPQWHLLVSYYAYIDAAFNHDNEELLNKTGWTTRKPIKREFGNNKVLSTWLEESKKS